MYNKNNKKANMRIFGLLISVFVIGISADQCDPGIDSCHPPFPCVPGSRIAEPSDCSVYKHCVAPYEWHVSTSECGGNKGSFSNVTCDCESKNACHTWTCDGNIEEPLAPSEPCFATECGSEYHTLPDRHYCTRYFECRDNNWISVQCPPDRPYYDIMSAFNELPCSPSISRCKLIPFHECETEPLPSTTASPAPTTNPSTTVQPTNGPPPAGEPDVAFSVARSEDFGPEPKNVRVPFDIITVNHGNGFNNNTSEFVAPVSGLYLFTFSLRGKSFRGYLAVNGVRTAGVSSMQGSGYRPSTSHSIVIEIVAGDTVHVILEGGDKIQGCDGKHCTFSGYCIQQY